MIKSKSFPFVSFQLTKFNTNHNVLFRLAFTNTLFSPVRIKLPVALIATRLVSFIPARHPILAHRFSPYFGITRGTKILNLRRESFGEHTRELTTMTSNDAVRDGIYGGGSGVTVKNKFKHCGTLIFLHGLGDTGHGWSPVMAMFELDHIQYILPTAPTIPISINGGFSMPGWFDIYGLTADSEVDRDGILEQVGRIEKMIDYQINVLQIPSEKILLGGFSQGGAVALTTFLRSKRKLAGVIAASTWLPLSEDYSQNHESVNAQGHIFYTHGEKDNVVDFDWGKMSSKKLEGLGYQVQFLPVPDMGHSVVPAQITKMTKFVSERLPRESNKKERL